MPVYVECVRGAGGSSVDVLHCLIVNAQGGRGGQKSTVDGDGGNGSEEEKPQPDIAPEVSRRVLHAITAFSRLFQSHTAACMHKSFESWS